MLYNRKHHPTAQRTLSRTLSTTRPASNIIVSAANNIILRQQNITAPKGSTQTVDKTIDFRQFDESFRPPFSKGGAVEAA
ncbi:MAG: hypothetical protein IJX13_04655 [Clostridia bacterium]|nr:hypothetical protein [Clostridia bacterium]